MLYLCTGTPHFSSHLAPQFRRQLPPYSLALVAYPAMIRVEEKQRINQLAGTTSFAVLFPPIRPCGKCFVRPAIKDGVEKLVYGDQDVFQAFHIDFSHFFMTTGDCSQLKKAVGN